MNSSFIARSACRGRRPASFAQDNGHHRPHLITRLLKERSVVRFIVAPGGYGKSSLALDYAETIFEWAHVFWINGQSPCFIRDLDAGTIARDCRLADGDVALVVMDDLPLLDLNRWELLSQEIDRLLGASCEVIITCHPSCDIPASLQQGRIRIGAKDLLLTEEEWTRTQGAASGEDSTPRAPSHRIAAICWPSQEEGESDGFVKRLFREELPGDLMLFMASLLVLQKGMVRTVEDLGLSGAASALDYLADYPHLSLDRESGRFDTVMLPPESIARGLGTRMQELPTYSSLGTREALARCWADRLLKEGRAQRACETVRCFAPRKSCVDWVLRSSRELFAQGCFFLPLSLMQDHRGISGRTKGEMLALEAYCLYVLGDEGEAMKSAKRVAFDKDSPKDLRAFCLILVGSCGKGTLVAQANAALRALMDGGSLDALTVDLGRIALARERGLEAMVEEWSWLVAEGADLCALDFGAAWIFQYLSSSPKDREEEAILPLALENHVRNRIAAKERKRLDFPAAAAGLAMEQAHGKGFGFNGAMLEAPVLLALRRMELSILSQRGAYGSFRLHQEERHRSLLQAKPDTYLAESGHSQLRSAERRVPTLELKLFGGFQVSIGGRPIPTERFRRQNARALLTVLAVNQGKEVPRDYLSALMWPDSDGEVARKNFYTVWSQLRKALSLPDGSCPYLLRHQFGCSLEARYVTSDVDRFTEICRELLFGRPDVERWSSLFAELDRDFSGELMPFESRNTLVVDARNEYRSRLVDALVSATTRIVEAGHPECGIWFARLALHHDETREDAYVALMQAQIAKNQRTAAMMTFLKCRRILDEKLGIDPSSEMSALYDSLLNV